MDNDIQKARRDLRLLPSSGNRAEALKLLQEIEQSRNEMELRHENFVRFLEKSRLTEGQNKRERWLLWFSAVLGCMAAYGGITAIIARELCTRSRGGRLDCLRGLSAQLEGVSILVVGVLLFILPFSSSRWRTVSLWASAIILLLSVLITIIFKH